MKRCPICGKGSLIVIKRKKLRGKYNPTVKKRKKPNLCWFYLPTDIKTFEGKILKKGKRVLICTKCRKKIKRKIGL